MFRRVRTQPSGERKKVKLVTVLWHNECVAPSAGLIAVYSLYLMALTQVCLFVTLIYYIIHIFTYFCALIDKSTACVSCVTFTGTLTTQLFQFDQVIARNCSLLQMKTMRLLNEANSQHKGRLYIHMGIYIK